MGDSTGGTGLFREIRSRSLPKIWSDLNSPGRSVSRRKRGGVLGKVLPYGNEISCVSNQEMTICEFAKPANGQRTKGRSSYLGQQSALWVEREDHRGPSTVRAVFLRGQFPDDP